jgi:hypothetical protein
MDIASLLPGIVSSSIAALVAAAGWFIAASRNYHFQHKLQVEREAREATGFRRIVVADVRTITMRLQPWVTSFAALRLDDLISVYQTLANDLRDKDIASSLSAQQYEVLFQLLDRFGRDVAHAQALFEQLPPIENGEQQWASPDAKKDWRHQIIANFEASVLLLLSAGEMLEDAVITDNAGGLQHLLNTGRGLNPYLSVDLFSS